MAAANFSRDDLIDLETVLENTPLYMECKQYLGDYRNLKKVAVVMWFSFFQISIVAKIMLTFHV